MSDSLQRYGCMAIRTTLMFDKKALGYSIIIAALVGILVAFLGSSFFPSWANASPLLKAAADL